MLLLCLFQSLFTDCRLACFISFEFLVRLVALGGYFLDLLVRLLLGQTGLLKAKVVIPVQRARRAGPREGLTPEVLLIAAYSAFLRPF